MIVSKCSETEYLFRNGRTRLWSAILSVAERKLAMLDAAAVLMDLRSPPGNRLEALEGNRKGQHSIRINGPENVEIVDYH